MKTHLVWIIISWTVTKGGKKKSHIFILYYFKQKWLIEYYIEIISLEVGRYQIERRGKGDFKNVACIASG